MTDKIDEKETEQTYTITLSHYLQLVKDSYFLGMKDREEYYSKGFEKGFVVGLDSKAKIYKDYETS